MKKYYATIQIILMFLLTVFISAAQQEKMPVTSISGSAVELYYEATAALENRELARGEALLDETLKKDPEFFMGLFQKAIINLCTGNQQEFKKCAESAFISYCAYSEGEKILQEALNRLHENPKADVTDLSRKLLQLYPEDKLVHYIQLTLQTIQEDYAGIPDETFLHSAPMIETSYPNQFRGTNCSGVAPAGAHPPVSLLPEENLAWKTKIASGVSSPCVWENSIFLTGYDPYDWQLTTYCIDKETGVVKWNQSVMPDAIEPVHAVGSPAAATPVTDGKHVYVYFGSYGVVCYNTKGNLVWEKKLPIPESDYGSCGSPVIANNMLLVNRLDELLALDKETGETIYTANIEGSHATPVVRGKQILLHQYLGLKSINIDNGNENWNLRLVTLGNSTPVLNKDMLFVNGFTNIGETRLYDTLPEFNVMLSLADLNADSLMQITEIPDTLALFRRPELDLPFPDDTMYSWQKVAPNFDFTKDGAMNETEWKQMKEYWEKYMVEHGVVAVKLPENETEKPELIWKESNFVAEVPSLLCTGSQVYMISNGGLVTCMNTETGEVIFREKLGAPGAYIASPLLANGYIYFVSYNGSITVVKPDDKLNVISQCNLKEKVAASPVATDNQLFVRTTETLYAFGE